MDWVRFEARPSTRSPATMLLTSPRSRSCSWPSGSWRDSRSASASTKSDLMRASMNSIFSSENPPKKPTPFSHSYPAFASYNPMSYSAQHLKETAEIVAKINPADCDKCVAELRAVREHGGRLFMLGVGGSAANASHAVNDFRKITGIETYAPTDNVSELTARTNDDGWASVFVEWLRTSRLSSKDCLFILSVGGGNVEKNVSPNLVAALQLAKQVGARIIGIVGKDGGYTAKVADACVIIPTVNPNNVTPHSEAFQAVIWHLFVSHPDLKVNQTKWESVTAKP